MRILLKILLFPITLVLSILVLVLQFITSFSSAFMTILALFFFAGGFVLLTLQSDWKGFLALLVVAFLLSPYGLTRLAYVIVEKLAYFNAYLKSF